MAAKTCLYLQETAVAFALDGDSECEENFGESVIAEHLLTQRTSSQWAIFLRSLRLHPHEDIDVIQRRPTGMLDNKLHSYTCRLEIIILRKPPAKIFRVLSVPPWLRRALGKKLRWEPISCTECGREIYPFVILCTQKCFPCKIHEVGLPALELVTSLAPPFLTYVTKTSRSISPSYSSQVEIYIFSSHSLSSYIHELATGSL